MDTATGGIMNAANGHFASSGIAGFNIDTYNQMFQSVNYKYYTFMFTVLAFDSIDTRLEAFRYIQEGKIQTKYIVDTRYNDLESSIYFVDTEDKAQMEYYEQSLLSDKAELDKVKAKRLSTIVANDKINPKWTVSRVRKYWDDNNGFVCACSDCKSKLGISFFSGCLGSCGSSRCIESLLNSLIANNIPVDPSVASVELDENDIKYLAEQPQESSCYHYNIIDIYKYASTFITCTIRALYNNRPKQFTHAEVSTADIPTSMVIM